MEDKKTSEIKRKIAIAIKDAQDNDKAQIIAKGVGKLAEKIISVAKENNIPIKEDADLLEILYKINVNQDIPEEMYGLIAEVLKFFYKLNQEAEEQLIQKEEEITKPKEPTKEPEPQPTKKEKWVITSIEDADDNNKK